MKNINNYNEETQLIIKQFVEDLFKVLPNLQNKISEEEIEKAILTNLDYDIEFNAEIGKGMSGLYNPKEKKVYISKKISGDPQQTKLTVFHELTHVITAIIYTDELIKFNPYICEVLTTLLEERYNQMIVKKQILHNRVNGYIPDFGRQLQIVYGEKLLEQFVVDPLNMYVIFNGFSDDIKKFLYKKTVKELNLLNYLIKNMEDDSKVKFTTREIEKTIADQLFYKVSTNNINEHLGLIEQLFCNQYYPDASVYSSMLFRITNYNQLEEYPILQSIKIIDQIDDKEMLIEQLRKMPSKEFPTKPIFGIIMQKIFGYACNDIQQLEPNIFDFLENEDVYSTVLNLITNGDISIQAMNNLKFKRCSNSNCKFTTRLTHDIFSEIYSYNSLPTFALFDSNDSMISIFNEYEIKYTKHKVSEIAKIINKPEKVSQIISYLNWLSEQTGICDFYWENFDSDVDERWEDWDMEIYYRNSESELTEVTISFDKNNKLKVKNKIITMNESKTLVVQAHNVNLETNFK